MVLGGLAAFAADPPTRLATYREQVQGRATGVYEIGDDLYVHVQMPVGKSENTSRLKMRASLKANELLRQWAFDYTKGDRAKMPAVSDGFARLLEILDDANPLWRIGDWEIRLTGQEHSGQDGKGFWLGPIVGKADMVRQIPESLRCAVPDRDKAIAALRSLLPQMVRQSPSHVYAKCGAVDLLDDKMSVPADIKTEYTAVEERLKAYQPQFEDDFLGLAPFGKSSEQPQRDSGKRAFEVFKGASDLSQKWDAVLFAMRENPDDKVLWNLCGRLLHMKGDNLGSLICFRRSLALDPQYGFALANAALAYRGLNCPKMAIGYAILALALSNDVWCREKALEVLDFDNHQRTVK